MNLIQSDYPLWTWEGSNGNATADQTRDAFDAVSNRGETAEFSHTVWNDLVDTLDTLLTAVGQSWDNKYTDASGAKVHEANGILTAKQFNSVRFNIENAVYTTWKWEFDYTKIGYVGRNDFKGVSDVGERRGRQADIVYGWYIIELARKLNLLIEFLRGTAETYEMRYERESKTECAVKFKTLKLVRLNPENKESRTCLESYMRVAKSIRMEMARQSTSELSTDMHADPAIICINDDLSSVISSMHEVGFATDESIPIIFLINSEKRIEVMLIPARIVPLSNLGKSTSEVWSKVISLATNPIVYFGNANTEHVSEMITAKECHWFNFSGLSDSEAQAELISLLCIPIIAITAAGSATEAKVVCLPPTPILISEYSLSDASVKIIPLPPTPIKINSESQSLTTTQVANDASVPVIVGEKSHSESGSQANWAPVEVIIASKSSSSIEDAHLNALTVKSIEAHTTSKTDNSNRMCVWYNPIKNKSNLYIRSVYSNATQNGNTLHIT